MNGTSAETWMNFNQVLRTEGTMKIVFICLICKCMCVFALYCLLKIGAFNCPIRKFFTNLHKRDLWPLIAPSLWIKKDIFRHLVKTGSMWVGQVTLELKCTPRYLTVCSRDNAPPLMRESGSRGELFLDKRGIPQIYSWLWEVHSQHSRPQDDGGRHPIPPEQNICCRNYKTRNHQHTSAVCYDRMRGSQYARRIEREKESLPPEHPHFLYRYEEHRPFMHNRCRLLVK